MKLKTFALIATLISSSVFAGFTNHYQINVSSTTAYGSMIGARNSSDSTQYIVCSYVGFSSNPYGICSARNSAGTSKSCTTTQAHHVEQIRGLSNESYLYFQWDSNGKCTYIYSSTGSMYHE
ncbi:hypothetical protein [Pleionea sp. CnH1-48]|uniref:hypothetical protein n=1 Tax=Pleionea sp. CnH1-48 TaxID=2954494 RepID=UPI002097A3B0|nr:hypothetical protein [Pleionea sp. CnH1-48]MCO7225003.1 hypothetical protein [Pleionea sp. CnH1-48]